LTAIGGLAALSLDALSSVAYGPEAIVLVLVAAGTAAVRLTLPIAVAITVLLLVLVVSYRQVIAVHPNGGGAYAVSGEAVSRVLRIVDPQGLLPTASTVEAAIAIVKDQPHRPPRPSRAPGIRDNPRRDANARCA
jgi:hypothetical protein